MVATSTEKEVNEMVSNSETERGFINPDGTATIGGRPGVGIACADTAASDLGLPPRVLRNSDPTGSAARAALDRTTAVAARSPAAPWL